MLTKPPILDETGQKILAGITRIKDALLGTASDPVTPGSAGSSGTEPVFQDDTGRNIITALNDLGTAVKPASYTDNGYVSTGEQYFKGRKTFTQGVMCLSNAEGTRYTEFDFRDVSLSDSPTTSGGARAAYIINQRPTAGSSLGNAMALVLRSPLSDGTGYASGGEVYKLPTAANDLSGTVQYDILTTKNLGDIPDASTSARGLVSTGSQTFAGTKQFNNGLYVVTGLYAVNTTYNGVSAPICKFSDAPSANEEYGRIFLAYANYGGRFKFRQYSGSSSARTSRREDYMLPEPDASRTSNADYDILTSKSPVTIAQGGTGATDVAGAVTALGLDDVPHITAGSLAATSDTFNFTLVGGHMYLVLVGRYASSATEATNGMYFVNTRSSTGTNGATITAIRASSIATLTNSGTTLTISTSATYLRYKIIDLS